jgi:OOP family OmpA-OmpF porin
MKRTILAVIVAASCNAAIAADTGAYVSASVGAAEQKLSVEGMSFTDDDTGMQIAAGYRITPHFGVELGYTTFGTGSIGVDGTSASSKPRAVYGAAVGSFNITPQFAITGKLGVARDRTKLSVRFDGETESMTESESSLVVGVGASYAFTPNVALIAEYQNFGKIVKIEGDTIKASIVSVGVRYSF